MEEDEEGEEESPRPGRTPASSGKKWMLSALFATPTTLRYSAMVEDQSRFDGSQANPEGTVNDVTGSETPSFLRRSHSARYATAHSANTGGLSPIAVRKPPQFIGKGLSAIVQGLRDMEDERLEDELDVLREIEAEQAALNANVEVDDSQAPAGNIGRPWKKKGQKRTTRRVRMKPVISKPASMPQGSRSDDESEHQGDEGVEELAAVPETQQPQPRTLDAAFEDQDENFDGEDDQVSFHTVSEADLDSDPDYGEDTRPVTKSKSFSEKMKEAIGVVQPQPQPVERPAKATQPVVKEDETKKVRARKVNPQAHANYRSLKIRNKNSKGRGAGRFRRR